MTIDKIDPLVELAKKAAEEYIKNKKIIRKEESTLSDQFNSSAGVFVCMKINNQLRGCIGTIEPVYDNLSEEIISNAISAATRDYRFDPVKSHELPDIKYSVDVLGEPEQVYSLNDLNQKIYGVIVTAGSKRGLLLPDLEGVDSVEDQVAIAMRKAGIVSDEKISLYRFKVTRHE